MTTTNVQSKRIQDWETFFSRCVRDHVDFPVFPKELRGQYERAPLKGNIVYECWAQQHKRDTRVRERLLCYFELLLQSGVVTDVHVVLSLSSSLGPTIATPQSYALRSGGWKQTLEAALLDRMAFQMANRKPRPLGRADRIPSLRLSKPLCLLLSRFCTACGEADTLVGPPLEIGNALGQYIIAYITQLSKVGLLTCSDGGPSQGTKYLPLYCWC